MSTLIDSLNEIYTTKLQIKEVIGTQSDVFSEYPAYIAAAIGTGGGIDWDEVAAYGYIVPAGTVTLSSNGTVDVSTYANAYVSVQSGGITPSGTYNITSNGTFNVTSYAYSYVNVPQEGLDWDDVAQAGYIVPAGTKNISSNGTVDVSTYTYAYVSVSGGGSGYYYPVHTVSDVTEFTVEDGSMSYMWQWSANELDEESGDFSSAVFTNKYWSYCYPTEFEIMENPVLNFDNFDMGFSMVSYTNLVKREYDYNSLPAFNTYRGYTYSYQYLNPEYDPEIGNEEYLTYEFHYGDNLLYKTALNIAKLSDREIYSPNEYYNGVWRVYDDSQPGLTGYYDETEYGEDNYVNQQWLSIGCLSPAETDGGPVTQFTTTYHGAASYTTGFDPRTLCGYIWFAVVDGRGWLVDLIDNDGDLIFSEMRLSDGDDETAAYLDEDNNDFIQEITLDSSQYIFDGLYIYAVEDMGDYPKNYKLHINNLDGYNLLNNDRITVGASCNAGVYVDNGYPNLYIDMEALNNVYIDWEMNLELVIPNTIKTGSEVTLRVTAFQGNPISQ